MNRFNRSLFRCQFVGVLCLLLVMSAALAFAQQSNTTFQPVVGQPGKDVVWVPTPQATVDNMLKLAKVTPQDYLIDLGSGDGITVITAAKQGVTAHGIEYNPDMVNLSKKKASEAGVSDKATFTQADLFQSDFSKATVITMFLLSDINLRLRPTLLNMKPGTRVVSNTFTMGDWTADETVTTPNCTSWCTALLWIVPAKVEGTWKTQQGELKLTQTFQNLAGTLGTTPINNGKMSGDRITFEAGGAKYDGRVNGNTIQGTVNSGRSTSFTATR
jgi:Methyltransferase domain